MTNTFVNPEDFMSFLNSVAERNGWIPGNSPARFLPGNVGINFSIEGVIKGTIQRIAVDLVLHKGTDEYWLVSTFAVLSDGPHTRAENALFHLGKGWTDNQLEVRCPADIEKLFRAYDLTTQLQGNPAVFNLP